MKEAVHEIDDNRSLTRTSCSLGKARRLFGNADHRRVPGPTELQRGDPKAASWHPNKNASMVRPAGQASSTDNGILYHGGPVMNNPHGANVYYIWYGNWDQSSKDILTYLAEHIGGSPYFNINTTYYDVDKEGERDPVLNKVNFMGSVDDHYSLGTYLSDQNVGNVLEGALGPGKLPIDANGVYFVLTSAFCLNACAWHAYDIYTPASGQTLNLKVGWVGNPNQCPAYCEVQNPSPNNNPAADSMASFVVHELQESVTDPLFNAWYDNNGNENADLCVWTFGDYVSLPNGSFFNMTLGTRPYMIQQNWVNAKGGYCALKWDE